MFESDLIRKLNGGRCFALVGAGASAEMGYPSWRKLASDVRDHVLKNNSKADVESYSQFLAAGQFPELFRQAEIDLGSRAALLALVKRLLDTSPRTSRRAVYDHLAKWPFACYLTTNYDDEILKALASAGQHFQVVQNTATELSLLRDGASHLVIKLHSDCDHAEQIVLTSRDYDRIISSPEGAYFRDKLRQIFEMFDVLIVGHSMSDPDMQLILATAKHTSSPLHPIYMIVANVTPGQAREYRERYNIHLLPYKDSDGTHAQLRRMLVVTDHFVSPRTASIRAIPRVDEEEIQAATSLFLHRRLRAVVAAEPLDELLGPLVLGVISSVGKSMNAAEIASHPAIAALATSHNLAPMISQAIDHLVAKRYVVGSNATFAISASGRELTARASQQRRIEEDQAFGQFLLDFKQLYPEASAVDCDLAKRAFRFALVASFRSRGLAMANVIVAGQSLSSDELPDVFHAISLEAGRFSDFDQKAAFIEAAHRFLVRPNTPQMRYLASISQGFFLYHLAGLDPTCAKVRRELFDKTCWFVDSSVLIPFLAVGSHNHAYARDLFGKLRNVNAWLFVTERLLKEAWRHLEWAIAFVKRCAVDSPDFLAAAMSREGFKQNLFLDGYVRLAADGVVGTFGDYIERVLANEISQAQLARKCADAGVAVLRIDEIEGFSQNDWGDIEELKASIAERRVQRGTFRGPLQVEAEAEVLEMIRQLRAGRYKLPEPVDTLERVYFLSQSRALDMVSAGNDVITWTPEAVYRYVSSLSGTDLDPELLQQCMLHEYFYAGISFVDRERYIKFFGPSISQAKLAYREQRDKYLAETEQTHRGSRFDEAFEHVPDLEKPFFVAQMGWQLARAAEEKADKASQRASMVEASAGGRVSEARAQVVAAEARAKTAEDEAEKSRIARIRAEQEANRLRNLQDPKHQQKRRRQAKRRRKRK